jgi:tetratricopeptide (TPR) repeat protein
VQRAIGLLQDGREAQAERLLETLMAEEGGDPTARLLLAQIRQPPEELLGDSFERLTVQPGDSLSQIAGRTMNNELLFYALARLNGIEVPRLLQAGQELRVPRIEMPESTMPARDSEPQADRRDSSGASSEAPPADNGAELVETARRLIEDGRNSQAYALLLSAARAGKIDPPESALLARVAIDLAAESCASDQTDRALEVLNQALPWVSESEAYGEFLQERRHLEARLRLDDAESALRRGNEEQAFDDLVEASELSADLGQRHAMRVERLTEALSMHFHDGALSAWRDQQVEDAIRLWEKVVRIAPEFVPAQRYLERARQARRELRSLDEE